MKSQSKVVFSLILVTIFIAALCSGCGSMLRPADDENVSAWELPDEAYINATFLADTQIVDDEVIVLSGEPAVSDTLLPVASGTHVKQTNKATLDYSNTSDGYIMVKFTATTTSKIKVQVKGPGGTTYTYNLQADGKYITLPLSDGNGSYKVGIYQNVSGNSYSTVTSVTFTAELKDQFAPFIRPNQYVNYNDDTLAVKYAAEITDGITDPLDMVKVIYDYVVKNYTYDYDKAATVKSGYLPDLDSVYNAKKGICFDYASLMTAMLRSQGVPSKLVIGYSGTVYHAWINVYSEDSGWINNVIFFDGTNWKLMDPTFASGAKQSSSIMKYIGDSSNYVAKYIY